MYISFLENIIGGGALVHHPKNLYYLHLTNGNNFNKNCNINNITITKMKTYKHR